MLSQTQGRDGERSREEEKREAEKEFRAGSWPAGYRGEDTQFWRNIREASTLIGTALLLFLTSQFLMEASTFIPVLLVGKARSGLDMDKRSFCH